MRHIETRIAQLESEGALSAEDVVVRAEPARQLLSLRRTVPSFSAARALIAELRAQCRRPIAEGRGRRRWWRSRIRRSSSTRSWTSSSALPSSEPPRVPPGSPLKLRELEAVPRMAVCVRVGLPEDAHLVTAKIGRFLEASGERLAGPSREVFLQPPDPERMHESVVEMQYPIASA